VATITLKPQGTAGLNFTSASLNGTYAASCAGDLGAYTDLNLAVFNNGTVSGTDPYNNDGTFAVDSIPYTGTYSVNPDGTFAGSLVVSGTSFDYYGVISNANSQIQYIYENESGRAATTAFSACVGAASPVNTATDAKSQTITFGAIAAQTAGTSLPLSASASSGLAVSFASTTQAVCTVSGSTASLLKPGSCSITASQAGNGTYATATPVSQSFTVYAAGTGFFTLASSASSVTVTPQTCFFIFCFGGSSATDTLTITPVNGFTGPVSFAVSGLPTGVTGAFAPATVTTSGSTRLTLTPGSGVASSKSTTLTVTATSGALSSTAKITLSY
jgi:hypothetical protein